jgi:hypothetical protein
MLESPMYYFLPNQYHTELLQPGKELIQTLNAGHPGLSFGFVVQNQCLASIFEQVTQGDGTDQPLLPLEGNKRYTLLAMNEETHRFIGTNSAAFLNQVAEVLEKLYPSMEITKDRTQISIPQLKLSFSHRLNIPSILDLAVTEHGEMHLPSNQRLRDWHDYAVEGIITYYGLSDALNIAKAALENDPSDNQLIENLAHLFNNLEAELSNGKRLSLDDANQLVLFFGEPQHINMSELKQRLIDQLWKLKGQSTVKRSEIEIQFASIIDYCQSILREGIRGKKALKTEVEELKKKNLMMEEIHRNHIDDLNVKLLNHMSLNAELQQKMPNVNLVDHHKIATEQNRELEKQCAALTQQLEAIQKLLAEKEVEIQTQQNKHQEEMKESKAEQLQMTNQIESLRKITTDQHNTSMTLMNTIKVLKQNLNEKKLETPAPIASTTDEATSAHSKNTQTLLRPLSPGNPLSPVATLPSIPSKVEPKNTDEIKHELTMGKLRKENTIDPKHYPLIQNFIINTLINRDLITVTDDLIIPEPPARKKIKQYSPEVFFAIPLKKNKKITFTDLLNLLNLINNLKILIDEEQTYHFSKAFMMLASIFNCEGKQVYEKQEIKSLYTDISTLLDWLAYNILTVHVINYLELQKDAPEIQYLSEIRTELVEIVGCLYHSKDDIHQECGSIMKFHDFLIDFRHILDRIVPMMASSPTDSQSVFSNFFNSTTPENLNFIEKYKKIQGQTNPVQQESALIYFNTRMKFSSQNIDHDPYPIQTLREFFDFMNKRHCATHQSRANPTMKFDPNIFGPAHLAYYLKKLLTSENKNLQYKAEMKLIGEQLAQVAKGTEDKIKETNEIAKLLREVSDPQQFIRNTIKLSEFLQKSSSMMENDQKTSLFKLILDFEQEASSLYTTSEFELHIQIIGSLINSPLFNDEKGQSIKDAFQHFRSKIMSSEFLYALESDLHFAKTLASHSSLIKDYLTSSKTQKSTEVLNSDAFKNLSQKLAQLRISYENHLDENRAMDIFIHHCYPKADRVMLSEFVQKTKQTEPELIDMEACMHSFYLMETITENIAFTQQRKEKYAASILKLKDEAEGLSSLKEAMQTLIILKSSLSQDDLQLITHYAACLLRLIRPNASPQDPQVLLMKLIRDFAEPVPKLTPAEYHDFISDISNFIQTFRYFITSDYVARYMSSDDLQSRLTLMDRFVALLSADPTHLIKEVQSAQEKSAVIQTEVKLFTEAITNGKLQRSHMVLFFKNRHKADADALLPAVISDLLNRKIINDNDELMTHLKSGPTPQ